MTDPSRAEHGWADARVERLIANLLRVGVLLAAAVTLIGGVLWLAQHGTSVVSHHDFIGEPTELLSVHGVLSGAAHFHLPALIQLGIVLLIATPVARVALTLCAFLLQRDWFYVGVATLVLIVLLYSLFISRPPVRSAASAPTPPASSP